jgi:hypothetical protein
LHARGHKTSFLMYCENHTIGTPDSPLTVRMIDKL